MLYIHLQYPAYELMSRFSPFPMPRSLYLNELYENKRNNRLVVADTNTRHHHHPIYMRKS